MTSITLHQDNAPCHKAQFTMDVFQRLNINLVDHPAYSPDLAPCDFALFPRLKAQLRGNRFNNEEALRRAVTDFVASIPAQEFKNIFVKWCGENVFNVKENILRKNNCYRLVCNVEL